MSGVFLLLTLNLSLGSSGEQVVMLQKMLNQDAGTRIALSGPGSPGQETSYFGLLTRAAVVRFQEKYASEILAPARLSSGTGYVGLYTRAKLNALSTVATAPVVPLLQSSPPTPTNPNEENLDKFFEAIDIVAVEKGLSSFEVATIKREVTKAIATTTNLREAFFKTVETDMRQASDDSFIGQALVMLESIFAPRAHAALTGLPFGGMLFFPFYCWNSNTWMLTIQPLPPTYVVLLSYVPGTQAFLSYNIPVTHELLGEYVPAGVCIFACPTCVVIPTQGTITPIVGSSPV